MTKRALLFGLLAAATVAGTGCHGLVRGGLLCPLGLWCDPQSCSDGCGPAYGPVRGAVCDAPCEPDCGPACATPCGPACGSPCGRPVGPLSCLFWLFRCNGCQGCGERYWGGYCSDPPDCCEPCDCLGNWTGGSRGGCYGGGDEGPGTVVGGPVTGGCAECAQRGTTTSGAPRAVLRNGRPAGTPTVAPRQAWRQRTPTAVPR